MSESLYQFEAVIEPVPDKGGAFVRVPFDIRKEFGQGRAKVEATFNGVPYCGSIVNMGVKTPMAPSATFWVFARTFRKPWAVIPVTPSW